MLDAGGGNIKVVLFKLNADEWAVFLDTSDSGCAGSHKRIEHDATGGSACELGKVAHQGERLDGYSGRMSIMAHPTRHLLEVRDQMIGYLFFFQ